jgi:TolB-like protein/DNA-binding SARP family transcriptional activator
MGTAIACIIGETTTELHSPMSTTRIGVHLLGSFAVGSPDGALRCRLSRRGIAVLACIAVEPRGAWTRQALASLLWHGRDPPHARASLRQELLRVRKELDVPRGSSWGSATRLALPEELLDIDVTHFHQALAEGRVEQAIEVYRGDLLQDFATTNDPFGQWLQKARSSLHRAAVSCLYAVLDNADAGAAVEAARASSRLLELEPWAEETCRRVIRWYLASGDFAGACDAYKRCATAMAQRYGTTPSEETRALVERTTASPPRLAPADDAQHFAHWIARVRRTASSPLLPREDPPPLIDDRPSIAILPLLDLSNDTRNSAILADGLTEELTSALARLPGLFVTARQSAMVYKAAAKDIRTIAAELGVRYVLEGSIDFDGRLRANVRLIDGRTGFHLWADTQTFADRDVMSVRDELVHEIASRLQPQLNFVEMKRALAQPARNLGAWTYLQRANGLLAFHRDTEALSEAVETLKRALEMEPDYAMVHALLAAVYSLRAVSMAFPHRDEERATAREHAELALRIEPENAFVLIHCAEALLYSAGNLDGAKALLERAADLGSTEPHGLALLAHVRRLMGEDPQVCLALIQEARRLSPRDPRTSRWHYYSSWCHLKLRHFKSMEVECRNSISLYSNHGWSWLALVCSLGCQDRPREAKEASKVLHEIMPEFSPDGYYDTVKRLYGRHFTAAVEADYIELRDVLSRLRP